MDNFLHSNYLTISTHSPINQLSQVCDKSAAPVVIKVRGWTGIPIEKGYVFQLSITKFFDTF
ncbi:MAG: hypothetical protein H6Q68_2104 [Firmicutes bacterium]|nr:hypothetical protein [Bacillota bacterium]